MKRKSYIPPYIQLSLDDVAAANLRDTGLQMAVDHANEVEPRWVEKAYDYFKNKFLLNTNGPFQCEDFRVFCQSMDFPMPPSHRAFGGIIVRAAKAGIIERVGFKNTRSVKGHKTPASVWQQVKPSKF